MAGPAGQGAFCAFRGMSGNIILAVFYDKIGGINR